jgi:hypothetical protein
MEKSPWKKRAARKKRVSHRIKFLERGIAKKGLATTTASGHEVQGREFAEDRHVRFSLHYPGASAPRLRPSEDEPLWTQPGAVVARSSHKAFP